MQIFRTETYQANLKRLLKLGATDADIVAMEQAIATDPEAGDVIAGTGGLRKARFGYGRVGKRGGGRTVYYAVLDEETVYLITAYAKVDKSDLTATEKRLFAALVKELSDD